MGALFSGFCRRRSCTFTGRSPRRTGPTGPQREALRTQWKSAIRRVVSILKRRKAWAAEGQRLNAVKGLTSHLTRSRGRLCYKR
jgi:hypothetical protein